MEIQYLGSISFNHKSSGLWDDVKICPDGMSPLSHYQEKPINPKTGNQVGGEKQFGITKEGFNFFYEHKTNELPSSFFFLKKDLLDYLDTAEYEFKHPTLEYCNKKFMSDIYEMKRKEVSDYEEIQTLNFFINMRENASAQYLWPLNNDSREKYYKMLRILLSNSTQGRQLPYTRCTFLKFIEKTTHKIYIYMKPEFIKKYTNEELGKILANDLSASDLSNDNLIGVSSIFVYKYRYQVCGNEDLDVDIIVNQCEGLDERQKKNVKESFMKAKEGLANMLSKEIEDGKAVVETIASRTANPSHNKLQVIYYGAPGTGKSNEIKLKTKGEKVIRTTFHPDSDYSTFVGSYKPVSNKKNILEGNGLNKNQLIECFKNSSDPSKYKNDIKARYLYEALINKVDIEANGLNHNSLATLLKQNGFSTCAYDGEHLCMTKIYNWLKEDGLLVKNSISYEFEPQAFVNAYVEAWKKLDSNNDIYLIIEEINRGNCAQIFGDLFQLLDRNNEGYSEYEVEPNTALKKYIAEQGINIAGVFDAHGNDISQEISNGSLLKLPPNLYIWATMNTSDQSLFPIDSAFKRRWDWKYIKITDGYKKNEDGSLMIDQSTGKKIRIAWTLDVTVPEKQEDGTNKDVKLDWWKFIQQINKVINKMTSSADKQLGYFFCKASPVSGVISLETFVSKVVFYLWNDVFKDYGFDEPKLFKYKNSEGKEDDLTFPDFYKEDGTVDADVVRQFVENVMSWTPTSKNDD